MNSENRAAVALFDGHQAPALCFLASLGRRGIPVEVFSPAGTSPARWSRYCRAFHRCPEPEDLDRFLPWLEDRIRTGAIGMIAPTSDVVAYATSVLRACLPADRIRMVAPLSDIQNCLFKDRFHQFCTAIGQAVPAAEFPATLEEAQAALLRLGTPVHLKPRSHLGVGIGPRGAVIDDAAELAEEFTPYPLKCHDRAAGLEAENLRLPFLQRRLGAAEPAVYSVVGIKDPDAGIVAASCILKLVQWPPRTGVGAAFRTVEPPPGLMDRALATVDRLLGAGLFELEFVEDAGRFYAIDLNPRGFGMLSLPMAAGHDLPWLWYRGTQAALQPVAPARTDLEWRNPVPLSAHRVFVGKRATAAAGYFRVPAVPAELDFPPRCAFHLRLLRRWPQWWRQSRVGKVMASEWRLLP